MGKETKEQYAKRYAMASYSDDVCATDRYALGKRVGLERGIIIGAEWRINSVWHNASEIPEYGRTILAICKDGRTIICGPNNSDWGETVGIFWIDNWAYIDDLTPKEE